MLFKNSLGFKYFLKPVHYLYFYCFAGGPADSAIEWCWTAGRSHYYSPQIGWPGQSKQMYQLLCVCVCVCVAWSQHYMLLFLLNEEYMCITASKRQLRTLIVPCSVFVEFSLSTFCVLLWWISIVFGLGTKQVTQAIKISQVLNKALLLMSPALMLFREKCLN